MLIFLATTGFKSNKVVQLLEVGEGGYLDIKVNGVVDIKKVMVDCMAQFYKMEGKDVFLEKCCCCLIGVVPSTE